MDRVIIVMKIMPKSVESNLESVKKSAEAFLKSEGAEQVSFEEKPVAFGLKALFVKTDFPEEKGTEFIERKVSEIAEVSSVSIEDYRRAFG